MTTPTPEEIADSIAQDVLTGDAERQIGDRRVRKESLKVRHEIQHLIAAEAAGGCFIRTGFKKANDSQPNTF